MTDVLCSAVGSLTNVSKITNTLRSVKKRKISDAKIAEYLSYLTDSFLFRQVKRYDIKGKKYFETPSKFYCEDIGPPECPPEPAAAGGNSYYGEYHLQ